MSPVRRRGTSAYADGGPPAIDMPTAVSPARIAAATRLNVRRPRDWACAGRAGWWCVFMWNLPFWD